MKWADTCLYRLYWYLWLVRSGFITDNRETEPDPACPIGWSPFQDSCYIAVGGPVSFPLANQTCVNEGGHLATIENGNENAFVHSQITVDSWIGYTDMVTEGTFLWVTGEPTTYTNWFSGAPDNLAPGQDCAIMYADNPGPGMWNDQDCSENRPYVCERGRRTYCTKQWLRCVYVYAQNECTTLLFDISMCFMSHTL